MLCIVCLLPDNTQYLVVDQTEVEAVRWPQTDRMKAVLPAQDVVQCRMPSVQGTDNI